ncbi:MAG: hypothetical protein ACK4GG_09055 [Sphingomonas sp.]
MLHIFCAAVPQFWPFQHDINVAFIASTVSGGESLKGWAGMKIPALFFCAQHGSLRKSSVFSLFCSDSAAWNRRITRYRQGLLPRGHRLTTPTGCRNDRRADDDETDSRHKAAGDHAAVLPHAPDVEMRFRVLDIGNLNTLSRGSVRGTTASTRCRAC